MISVNWSSDRNEIASLARFFASNVTQSYISHSELQFGRAERPDKWIDNLVHHVSAEISERIPYAPLAPLRVASALTDNRLAGLAYVTFTTNVPIPFIVIEDIVVDRSQRGNGIGQAMMDWSGS